MLRDGLLARLAVVTHGAPVALAGHLGSLGAAVSPVTDDVPADLGAVDEHLATIAAAHPTVDLVVADARGAFADAGGGYPGLRAGLDGAFAATRAVANAHWIDTDRAGRVVLIAPAPGAGEHAGALRAALENTARTLATEWARHTVTTCAVLPGDTTTGAELADLVAWLASPAGAYVSGTALTLGSLPTAAPY